MKVCVIGTGTMGTSIAKLLCSRQVVSELLIVSRSNNNADKVTKSCQAYLHKLWEKDVIAKSDIEKCLSKIRISTNPSDLIGSDLLIEAVPESTEVKHSVYLEIAKYVKHDTIVASNTSSMSITDFAFKLPYPENVVGLHFFNPATAMKLVEIVVGQVTLASVVDRLRDFSEKLDKEPVVVKEAPGFIVNRMLIPMINEGISILAENLAESKDIDNAMKFGAGHPMGPLELADLIGTDVCLSIMDTLFRETGDMKYRANPLLRKMVRANLIGRKSGKGFYNYSH